MLIVNAEIDGRPDLCVRVSGETITAVGPRLKHQATDDEVILDAAGGAVIPGIHDHHVHLRAAAAASDSVRLGPSEVTDRPAFEARLRSAASAPTASPSEWIRGIGYHESVAGPLDRERLDQLVPSQPVRIQHRTGALWVLNSRALDAIDADRHRLPGIERDERGVPTGRLWRLDSWLRSLVPRLPLDLAGLSRTAATMGITGFTDATPDRSVDDVAAFERLVDTGEIMQRLTLMAPGDIPWPTQASVRRGPVKLVLDDHDLPEVGDLAESVRQAHRQGHPVAVHCVTADQLVILTAALAEAQPGKGDRIEHAAVVPPALTRDLRALGVTVVTQPSFVYERGDEYLKDVEPEEQPWLWPCASLLDSGVPVAASSDAPHGCLDPWVAVRAATLRETRGRRVLTRRERVTADVALSMFLGTSWCPRRPRRVAAGQDADVCVLTAPLSDVLRHPTKDAVAATIIAGKVVFGGTDA